jgi:hypothetical protein
MRSFRDFLFVHQRNKERVVLKYIFSMVVLSRASNHEMCFVARYGDLVLYPQYFFSMVVLSRVSYGARRWSSVSCVLSRALSKKY